MTLEEKLRKIKHLDKDKTKSEWDVYKKQWIESIKELQQTVQKWFEAYHDKGLMDFAMVPTGRVDPYIGEYLTFYLVITLANNKSFILSPVSGITSEYDGKLEFYMQGNFDKKINILRKLGEHKPIRSMQRWEWIIAKSNGPKDQVTLNKAELENIINEWLS